MKAELKPLLDHRGEQKFADAGATHQGGPRPIKVCGECQRAVVFVQSKAGKWYLADCFGYQGAHRERYYYVKASPHFKTCAQAKLVLDAQVAGSDYKALEQKKGAELDAIVGELKERGLTGEALAQEFEIRWAEVVEKYQPELARLEAIKEAPYQPKEA